eukprot:750709-Hanusia_phi.AAC.2
MTRDFGEARRCEGFLGQNARVVDMPGISRVMTDTSLGPAGPGKWDGGGTRVMRGSDHRADSEVRWGGLDHKRVAADTRRGGLSEGKRGIAYPGAPAARPGAERYGYLRVREPVARGRIKSRSPADIKKDTRPPVTTVISMSEIRVDMRDLGVSEIIGRTTAAI